MVVTWKESETVVFIFMEELKAISGEVHNEGFYIQVYLNSAIILLYSKDPYLSLLLFFFVVSYPIVFQLHSLLILQRLSLRKHKDLPRCLIILDLDLHKEIRRNR
jgi:uncharacterized paraquat-inducible protein A